MIRTALFWTHLTAGITAAAIIVVMSATGVALMYEKQLVERAERSLWLPATETCAPLSPSALVERARAEGPGHFDGFRVARLTLRPEPRAPVRASGGGGDRLYLSPCDGTVLSTGFPRLESALDALRGWHRWLNLGPDARRTGRAVTGAANLVFLLLLSSGLLLWIPRKRTWVQFRQVIFFRRGLRAKARDFNWHNVLGVWSAVPLVVVVSSATVISYAWAADVVSWVAAQSPALASDDPGPVSATAEVAVAEVDLDAVVQAAKEAALDWQEIEIDVPARPTPDVTVAVYRGTRGQPQLQESLVFDASTAALLERGTFGREPRGRRYRTFLRFAHTGEYWGLVGQTVAGLVSLSAVLMALTGVMLSIRRLSAARRRARNP